MAKFDLDMAAELRTIAKKREKLGLPEVIGDRVAALIAELTDGGVGGTREDIRHLAAQRYWDRFRVYFQEEGIARCGDEYFASIPQIPQDLYDRSNPVRRLVLEEPRIPLETLCRVYGIEVLHDALDGVPADHRYADPKAPRWILLGDMTQLYKVSMQQWHDARDHERLALTVRQGILAATVHDDFVTEKPSRRVLLGGTNIGDDVLCLLRHGRQLILTNADKTHHALDYVVGTRFEEML